MKQIKTRDIVTYILLALLFFFAIYKCTIGMHSDEIYCVTLGDVISKGDAFFVDCWSSLQMAAVISGPVFGLYRLIVGSTEGIILFLRIVYVFIQALIALYLYLTFKENKNRNLLLAAVLMFFVFVPDFNSFGYKSEMISLSALEIAYGYRYLKTGKVRYTIFLGIAIALCVLVFPTSVIHFVMWAALFAYFEKNLFRNKGILWMTLTCALCGILFVGFVAAQTSIKDFIEFFPLSVKDDQLNTSFISKLIHPVKKIVAMGIMCIVPLGICFKVKALNKFVTRFRLPLITGLYLLAFAGQCYIERRGLTWHCITYPYCLALFILPFVYFISQEKNEDEKLLFAVFNTMGWCSFFCFALASNQGNITSMYGSLFSLLGFALFEAGREYGNDKTWLFADRKISVYALLLMSLFMFIVPVWDQEAIDTETYGARNIFNHREVIDFGPAKGIKTGETMKERYVDICTVVKEETTASDLVYIVETPFYCPFGYLYMEGDYATLSPRGGYSDRIVEYYEMVPKKIPSVVIISKPYIGEKNDADYPAGTLFGEFIDKNGYSRKETDKFIIYRK